MMKKILAFTLVIAMMLALAIPAMAANVKVVGSKDGAVLYSEANEWRVSVPYSGIVVFKDNKVTYTVNFDKGGTYSLGLQKIYTGQLSLVSYVHICKDFDVFTKPATCIAEGYEIKTCTECGEKEITVLVINPENHAGPMCEKGGECLACGECTCPTEPVDRKDEVTLIKNGNVWNVTVPCAGTLVVKDNNNTYEFEFDGEGTYYLGLQNNYTGHLSVVSYK